MTTFSKLSKEQIIQAIKESFSLKEACAKLNIIVNTRNTYNIKTFIKKNNVNTSHFKFINVLNNYNENTKKCVYCGKELPYEKRYNKFCNSSCAAKYNNPLKKIHYTCINCGRTLEYNHKYCSNKCQQAHIYKQCVENYKQDNKNAKSTKYGQLPAFLRHYIFNKFNNKCSRCGWSEINNFTNTLPLEIHHIDCDNTNNSEDNLELLCPNCHSLTLGYKGNNRGNERNITWVLKN